MVTIIKNQLLKHLSIYTKNLSPEQINVSALKGQGSLSFLELDEAVLTELLELPTWMKISSATCGRATFRVHWTKLKTMPIELNLEDVQIKAITCSEVRTGGDTPTKVPVIPPTRYSFIQKVIDGISITVNTVKIQFTSPVFIATVQLSRISVESKTPQWQKGDLRLTRLKDPNNSQILIFKEVSWLSARIEAHAVKEGGSLPPLRLLTNQAHCRITIKKRLSDCFVVGSRLVLILEEALWVLTDRQLGAGLAFADSLVSLVKQSTAQVTRTKAKRKLETLPEYLAQISQAERASTGSATVKTHSKDPLVRLFHRHDVTETSYHFLSQRIDLHLCDDPGPGRSSHPSLASGAALQVSLQALQVDYYPYHLASADRNHWPGYRESAGPHSQWLKQTLTAFRGNLLSLLEELSQKSNGSDYFMGMTPNSAKSNSTPNSPPSTSTSHLSQNTSSPARKMLTHQLAKLMTSCIILRLEDYTLYKVTTGDKKESPKAFISGDRDRFTMPDEVRAFHLEFTNFYYPGDMQFPIPSPKLFLQINPVRVMFDLPSCLWCNSFMLNLLSCLQATEVANAAGDSDFAYVDITVEAIMPRVIIDGGKDHPGQRDRPRSLQAQVSRATVTNSNNIIGNVGELASCLAAYSGSALLAPTCCTDTMLRHAAGEEKQPFSNGDNPLKARALWGPPRTIWCVKLEPVWADFYGTKTSPNKPTPLLDAVPFTFWVYINMNDNKNGYGGLRNMRTNAAVKNISNDNAYDLLQDELLLEGEADMQIVAQCSQLVSIQLNHYQFLFLLRLAEKLTELSAFLSLDSARVDGPGVKAKSLIFGCSIPQVEVTLVLPSCCPGKESSRDLDSVLPDSSSLMDLQQNNGSGTLCHQPIANGSNILSQSSLEKHTIITSSLVGINNTGLQPLPLSEQTIQIQTMESGEWTHLNRNEASDSPLSIPSKDGLPNIPNFNAGISSVKRGFTSLISSIDAALKPSDNMNTSMSAGPSPGAGTPSGDQWDNASVASSDSERYIMVQLAGEVDDGAFRLWDGLGNPKDCAVEVAAEVLEHSSSPSERSLASSCRRRDLVSMSTFILRQVEVHQISRGFYSRVSANVGDVTAEDCNSIPWDELQSKFSSRSRGWMDGVEGTSIKNNEPKVMLKLEKFPHRFINIPYKIEDTITLEALMTSFANQVNVLVKNLNLTLNMSTAIGLADFIEDEVIVPPIPLEVLLESMCLELNEDRPASSISSPGAIPVRMTLDGLRLTRDKEGILNIRPASLGPTTPLTQNSSSSATYTDPNDENSMIKLLQENELLKRKLNALERLAVENDTLRRSKEETDVLKACLLTAQDEVAALLDEKNTLLHTVRLLQEQASGVEMRGMAGVFGRGNKR